MQTTIPGRARRYAVDFTSGSRAPGRGRLINMPRGCERCGIIWRTLDAGPAVGWSLSAGGFLPNGGRDKRRAAGTPWRVPGKTLWLFALLGELPAAGWGGPFTTRPATGISGTASPCWRRWTPLCCWLRLG